MKFAVSPTTPLIPRLDWTEERSAGVRTSPALIEESDDVYMAAKCWAKPFDPTVSLKRSAALAADVPLIVGFAPAAKPCRRSLNSDAPGSAIPLETSEAAVI